MMANGRLNHAAGRVLRLFYAYLPLSLFCFGVCYPMFWLMFSSLKSDRAIFLYPFAMPTWHDLAWDNYRLAWSQAHLGRYFLNSALVTGLSILGILLLGSMAAHVMARFRFAGQRVCSLYFLSGLMLPAQLTVIPTFFMLRSMGLLHSLTGLILIYMATGLPFAILVLTGFYRSLPHVLYEAAVIEGANQWQAFWHIMLPLTRPGLVSVAIFSYLGVWNEYLYAYLLLSGDSEARWFTLPLGLAQITIQSQYRSNWGVAFAGLVMVMLPTLIFFICLHRQVMGGISSAAIKG